MQNYYLITIILSYVIILLCNFSISLSLLLYNSLISFLYLWIECNSTSNCVSFSFEFTWFSYMFKVFIKSLFFKVNSWFKLFLYSNLCAKYLFALLICLSNFSSRFFMASLYIFFRVILSFCNFLFKSSIFKLYLFLKVKYSFWSVFLSSINDYICCSISLSFPYTSFIWL